MVIHDLDVKWVPPWIGNLHKWFLISMLFQKWWYICCTLPFLLMPVLAVHHVSLRQSIPICSWFCRISRDYWHILVLQIRNWIIDYSTFSWRETNLSCVFSRCRTLPTWKVMAGRPSHSGRWQSKCTLMDEKLDFPIRRGEKDLTALVSWYFMGIWCPILILFNIVAVTICHS